MFAQQWKFPPVYSFTHSTNNYLWNSSHGKLLCKSVTGDSKIMINRKNFAYQWGWGIQWGVSGRLPGGQGLGTRENYIQILALSVTGWLQDVAEALWASVFLFSMWIYHHSLNSHVHFVLCLPAIYLCSLVKFLPQCHGGIWPVDPQQMLFYLLLSF